jgi:glycosyltransferase involved in cell wall biosynthesis
VLVTDEGGPCENIADNATGFVCPDLRAFARRVSELAWHPERLTRMREAARRYALDRQWPAALEPVFRAYREVATGTAEAPSMVGRHVASRPA